MLIILALKINSKCVFFTDKYSHTLIFIFKSVYGNIKIIRLCGSPTKPTFFLQQKKYRKQLFKMKAKTINNNNNTNPHNTENCPGGSDSKVSVYNVGDPGSIPGSGRSPGEGNGNPFQYYCLENPMDRGAW